VSNPGAGGGATNSVVQVIREPAPSAQVKDTTASALSVSRLALAQRISITRLRVQGLRVSMRLQEGTNVVRIAVYRARNGKRSGRALFVTTRAPRSAGLYRVTLRDRSLLRKLKTGRYVMEVRAGQSPALLGGASRRLFQVVR
jgi:hypothetical protein